MIIISGVYVNGCPIISPLKPPTEKTLTGNLIFPHFNRKAYACLDLAYINSGRAKKLVKNYFVYHMYRNFTLDVDCKKHKNLEELHLERKCGKNKLLANTFLLCHGFFLSFQPLFIFCQLFLSIGQV